MNPRTRERANLLPLLHLCDSLFPIGGFAYSDGLETVAHVRLQPDATYDPISDLREWMDVCTEETFARLEGPVVARAWLAFGVADWDALIALDRDVTALRAAGAARRASRAMGNR